MKYIKVIITFIFIVILSAAPLNLYPNLLAESAVRGVPGDGWADVIIGQPDFSEVSPYSVVSTMMHLPHGVYIDTNNPLDNKMYVSDAGNNRILGYNLAECLESETNPLNCEPNIIIGQPSANTSACNGDSAYQNYPIRAPATASTLCLLQEDQLSISEGGSGASMAVDSQGNLYFPDFWNNRVLKYNAPLSEDTSAGKGDAIADEVWGQADFTGILCNRGLAQPAANTLCFSWGNSNNWTAGVDIDSQDNLWIVDSGNNRVLRFNNTSGSISKTPSLVLGQSNYTSATSGSTLSKLRDPNAVRVNDDGVVYVSERYNNRILKFSPPLTNGMSGSTFGSGFNAPSGVDFDPTEPDSLWISNTNDNSLELWSENSGTLVRTLGGADGNIIGDVTGSIGVDSEGNVYAATGLGNYNNTVIIFEKDGDDVIPSTTLTQPTSVGNFKDINQLAVGRGLAVTEDQVIVADQDRIMFWNTPNGITDLYTGKPADGTVSRPTEDYGPCCMYLKTDEDGHLYTSFGTHNLPARIAVYNLPLTQGEIPFKEIAFPLNLLGGGTIQAGPSYSDGIPGFLPTPHSEFLWVSTSMYNRVVRIRDPLGVSPVVDYVIGQTNATNNQCNRGGNPVSGATSVTICNAGALALDRFGNFYLADHWLEAYGNNRTLIYLNGTLPTDNTSVIYNIIAPDVIVQNIAMWEPAFDSQNRMVVGFNPYWTGTPFPIEDRWFPAVYEDIIDSGSGTPDYFLKDYHSMVFNAAFDEDDNLYITDLNRGRVLIYLAPLADNNPQLTQVTPVPSVVSDRTPNYTFHTDKAGTLTYGGDCSSSVTNAVIGNNTITFNTLSIGIHSNCTIRLTDSQDYQSNILNVNTFTISFKSRGDFNSDGNINLSDLSILATYWMKSNTAADANNDNSVNISDLSILAQYWMQNF